MAAARILPLIEWSEQFRHHTRHRALCRWTQPADTRNRRNPAPREFRALCQKSPAPEEFPLLHSIRKAEPSRKRTPTDRRRRAAAGIAKRSQMLGLAHLHPKGVESPGKRRFDSGQPRGRRCPRPGQTKASRYRAREVFARWQKPSPELQTQPVRRTIARHRCPPTGPLRLIPAPRSAGIPQSPLAN